uniref:SFRICE_006887 n=1 Tax=Spodoptera frugiperda TaxID=7108 RepID=A0A2H1W6W3_SPOFR
MDDVTNILHRTYEVCMRINTDRKSQRTTVGQKARQADHLAWSEDPPLLRELYSLFPKQLSKRKNNVTPFYPRRESPTFRSSAIWRTSRVNELSKQFGWAPKDIGVGCAAEASVVDRAT